VPIGPAVALGGFFILFLLLCYAIWCACGFVCAWGIERVLASFGGVFAKKNDGMH